MLDNGESVLILNEERGKVKSNPYANFQFQDESVIEKIKAKKKFVSFNHLIQEK